MSTSSKPDAGPDKGVNASGIHGSYGVASMDRSSSFHENAGNPLLSSLPSMTRSSSCLTQGDVLNFFQCVRFDPKAVVVEHKLNRPAEFSRLASTAAGIPLEDPLPASSKSKQLSSSSAEDLRRLKSGVRESGTKARERVKIFNDCLSVINKCFPTIPSKKRSRLNAFSLSQIDHSAVGSKLVTQSQVSTSGRDPDPQKCEDRSKKAVLNKRPRTSMIDSRIDVRLNPGKPSETMVKDVRYSGMIQEADGNSSIGVDGWEKPRMKKKRSGIKPDIVASSMETKPVDAYRESKNRMQQRIQTKARSTSTDSHGFRTGIAYGGVGPGKAEATSQTSSGIRSSASRTDSENCSLLQERREHPGGQNKVRVNSKAVNKENSCNDFDSGSPISGPMLNTNVRAPRSSSAGGISKLVRRSLPSNDWELSNRTSKFPLVGNNRQRAPVRSSSPPVGNWVQRPQKISRTARRTNLLPSFPTNDENERELPAQSPQQFKIKGANFSPVTLSESEESGAGVNLSKKCEKIEEKSAQNVHKMSTVLLPPRKKKVTTGVNCGEGVKRNGRTGRGSTKQVRSSRPSLDNSERVGRQPTRKLSDRKAYPRQKHFVLNTVPDFLVGSDIGEKEFLAAVNAVIDTAQFLASPFWKGMESLFRFIADKDISFLKDQKKRGLSIDTPTPLPLDVDNSILIPNGYGFNEFGKDESDRKTPNEISLYQRLMSAIIPEEGFIAKDNNHDIYGSQLEEEKDMEGDTSMSENLFYGQDSSRLDTTFVSIPVKSCHYLQSDEPGHEAKLGKAFLENGYHNMTMDEKLILELGSIGVYPDLESEDDEIFRDISRLDEKYREKASRKKSLLGHLLSSVSEAKDLQEKDFKGLALDKLVELAYQKYMSCCGRNIHGIKSASGKMAKQAALEFVKRVLETYQEFERTRKSCFDEPLYKDLFRSKVSCLVNVPLNLSTDSDSGKLNHNTSGCLAEIRTPAPMGAQQSPSNTLDIYSSDVISDTLTIDQSTGKEDNWSHKVKRRELLLDDVAVMTSLSPGIPSTINGSFSCNAKRKRSGTGKTGRPATATVKSERKSKAKPKQKNTNLSASVVALGNMPKKQKVMSSAINSNDFDDMLEEPIDLSALQIPEMDGFSVHDDLGGQGEDLGSWLNIEDDGLEYDFMGGLEIPMDDLSDLNMLG